MLGAGADPRSNPQTWDEHAVGCANQYVVVIVALALTCVNVNFRSCAMQDEASCEKCDFVKNEQL